MNTRLISALLLGSVAAFSSANLIVNGTFEADGVQTSHTNVSSITGWNLVGSGTPAWVPTGYLGAPSTEIDLSGTNDVKPGTGITQSFSTTVGQAYTLSFDYYTGDSAAGHIGTIDAFVDSTQVADELNSRTSGNSRLNFTTTFVATSSTTLLSLLAGEEYQVNHVDNVSVEAVPEPASMAALAVGALALLRRRRNAK